MRRLYSSNRRRDSVDRRKLLAQIAHVRRRVDLRRADDTLERLARRVLAAVAVQVLAEPVAQGCELALLEAVVDVRQLREHALPDLRRDQVAERVRREVADRAARPVDVLQNSLRVVGDADPEVVPHPAVPLVRKLLEREVVGQHRLLELEAQDDVEVVRRLVGLDTDEGRLDDVDLAVPALDVVAGKRVGIQLLQTREEVAPEGQRAADEVLPHSALRLVHAERHAARERRPLERGIDLVLVEPVPELVHRPEEAAEVVREVARRDAYVADPRARRERMHRRIQPPRVVGEAESVRDLELEDLLLLDRERVLARPVGCLLRHLLHERRLVLLQVVEDAPDFLCPHPALVVVEHDVVRLVVDLEAVDVTLAQVEVLAQHRQEALEVVVLPRLHPDGICERGGARYLRAQVRRNLARLLPVVRNDADQARLERVVVLLLAPAAEIVDELADLRRDELLVRDATDGRQLLGADRRAAWRHHHVLVPAQHGRRLAEIGDLRQPPPELVETLPAHTRRERYMRRAGGPGGRLRGRPSPQDEPDPVVTVDGVCIHRLLKRGPTGEIKYGQQTPRLARAVASCSFIGCNELDDSLQTTVSCRPR